jgi:hypothetical protein
MHAFHTCHSLHIIKDGKGTCIYIHWHRQYLRMPVHACFYFHSAMTFEASLARGKIHHPNDPAGIGILRIGFTNALKINSGT